MLSCQYFVRRHRGFHPAVLVLQRSGTGQAAQRALCTLRQTGRREFPTAATITRVNRCKHSPAVFSAHQKEEFSLCWVQKDGTLHSWLSWMDVHDVNFHSNCCLFSQAALLPQKYHQLRIKILGDCYYCICGLPDYREDHAACSIMMGLAMVEAIS